MGIIVSIQPLVAADCFGRRAFGRIYGFIYLAIQIGTGLGLLVFGLTATAFGSYLRSPGRRGGYAAAGRLRDALGRPPAVAVLPDELHRSSVCDRLTSLLQSRRVSACRTLVGSSWR